MRSPRRPHRALPFLSLLLTLSVLGACGTSGTALRPGSAAPSERALAERAQRLTQDVQWLAAPEREGRRAGTAAEREAAEWLAARLADLGLEPAGEQGFLQAFPVPLSPEDRGGSRIEGRDGRGALALDDLRPLFCAQGGVAEGPLWFHGYGIDEAELGLAEHGPRGAGAPEGRIALLVRGAPPAWGAGEAEREEALRLLAPHRALFAKVMAAKHRGAAAVLIAQHPDERGAPLLEFDPGSGARAGIPALFVSVATAERLLPDFEARVRALDADPRASAPAEVEGAELRVSADVWRGTGTAYNVLGLLRGSASSAGARPLLIVGGHFDHLGLGGPGSLAPAEFGAVHHGADDNASGVAVILELARELGAAPPPADVLFALWSGEELGLLGSQHFLERPTVSLERLRFKLNLDMVGRAGNGRLIVLAAGSSPAFAGWLAEAGPAAGLELDVNLSAQGVGGSDHQPFVRRRVPALHLFSGLHGDYHRPSDTADRFEALGAARVTTLSLDLLRRAARAGELPFAEESAAEPAGEGRAMRGFAVRFGSQPDYGFSGPGVRLGGTSPGSPAERAGFLAGDVLIGMDELRIDSVQDLMYALGVKKPGDVVRVRFLREGREESALVTLVSSQRE